LGAEGPRSFLGGAQCVREAVSLRSMPTHAIRPHEWGTRPYGDPVRRAEQAEGLTGGEGFGRVARTEDSG
jgi:hypothetical protein